MSDTHNGVHYYNIRVFNFVLYTKKHTKYTVWVILQFNFYLNFLTQFKTVRKRKDTLHLLNLC